MLKLTRAAIVAALLAAPVAVSADDGDDYKFILFNSSAASAIEFATVNPSGKWSANWLSSPMKPATKRTLRFREGDQRCKVRTRISFSDGSKFDQTLQYCGVTMLTATDDSLYSE